MLGYTKWEYWSLTNTKRILCLKQLSAGQMPGKTHNDQKITTIKCRMIFLCSVYCNENGRVFNNSKNLRFLYQLFSVLFCLSPFLCSLKLWTLKGFKKLHEFLADMGVPLSECKQKFSAMDMGLKDNVAEWLVTSARKFGWVYIFIKGSGVDFSKTVLT